MPLAQIGPFTALLEALATAVGAGAVLVSALFGVAALVSRRSLRWAEHYALIGGCLGGGAGASLALADFILRHVLQK
jgi:hypothetical protein